MARRAPGAKRRSPPKEDRRPSAHARGYGRRWQKASKGFLAKHPLCRLCERKRRTKPATIVDHVIPHRGDMQLFWDRSNWQSLCKTCHDWKTATQDGGFGRPTQGGNRDA